MAMEGIEHLVSQLDGTGVKNCHPPHVKEWDSLGPAEDPAVGRHHRKGLCVKDTASKEATGDGGNRTPHLPAVLT